MSVLLADHFKEFDKENLDVELQIVPTTDGSVLTAQGKAQVQLSGFNAAAFNLLARDNSPLKYTTTAAQEQPPSEGLYVNNDFVKDGNIDPVKIRGQQVSFGPGAGSFGSPGAGSFYLAAKKVGLPLDSVVLANIPGSIDVANALIRGQIAGGSLFGAAVNVLQPEKSRFTLVQQSPPIALFLSNSQWLKDEPEAAAAFFRAIMRTNRTYLQGDYLADKTVLDAQAQILGSTPENVIQSGLAKYSADLDAANQKQLFPVYQNMFREAKVLSYDKTLTVDDIFDESPVAAVRDGKY
ncbi:hypothetical protein [Pseudonocardia ailaonensis]